MAIERKNNLMKDYTQFLSGIKNQDVQLENIKKSDIIKIAEEVLKEFNLFGKKKEEPAISKQNDPVDRRKNKTYSQFPKQAKTHRSSDNPINGNEYRSGDTYKDYTSMRTTPVNQEAPRRATDSPHEDYSKKLGPHSRFNPVDLKKQGIDVNNYQKSKELGIEGDIGSVA